MRNALRYLLIVVLSLILGAHFLRRDIPGLALTCTVFPILLAFRRRWCSYVVSLFLLAGAALWLHTTDTLVGVYSAMEMPWLHVFALAVYAAFVAESLIASRSTARLRGRL